MKQRINPIFFTFLFLFSSVFISAQHEVAHQGETAEIEKAEKSFDAKKMIMEHIGDSNEWHLVTLNEGTADEKHISVPLPIIIKDQTGIHTFLSNL